MEWTDPSNGDSVSLSNEKINIEAGINLARSPSAGAVSTFLGTTRDTFESKDVTSLSYESYSDMAINCMQEICQKIRSQWDVTRIIIQHKLGDCPVSEVSVLIAVSSPHRTESLKAIEFAINELKKTVPIWKKENYGPGDSVWKENVDINPNSGVCIPDAPLLEILK